jgi:histidinol-phosphate aminotransferase
METIPRRDWLKQSSLLLAGLGFSGNLFSREKVPYGFDNQVDLEYIRISSNENPYGPSPMAQKAMTEAISKSNRYTYRDLPALLKKIGNAHGLDENYILLGAGSSEILGNTALLASKQKGNAVSPHPTFRLWWGPAESYGLAIKKVPLTTDKKINTANLLDAIDNETRMLYICNPNNPTGAVIPADELRRCIAIASQRCLILLDEAYTEYSDEPSMASLVIENKNLVIAKTFSKIHGMAGARIGYAIAHPDTIKQLGKVQSWANLSPSAVSIAGASASLDDRDFLKLSRSNNDKVKKFAEESFGAMQIPFIPSHTNFIYYQASAFKGDLAAAINSDSLNAVRVFEDGGSWYRTSLGTMDEMKVFFDTLKSKWG